MSNVTIREDDPERRARLYRQRAAQGLPPTIEDPAALRRLARLVLVALDRKTKQR